MNKILKNLINENIDVELSGKQNVKGTLIDSGENLFVIFNGKNYLYIPILHVKKIEKLNRLEEELLMSGNGEDPSINVDETLSLRKVLTSAKGLFVEIYVTGNKSLHGYITSIMNNYFAFYSPIYKMMYISLSHLKWLIPYTGDERPYNLDNGALPLLPNNAPLARTFEIQIEKFVNELVVFNVHELDSVVGKINKVEGNIVELQTARNSSVYLNFQHLKLVHKV